MAEKRARGLEEQRDVAVAEAFQLRHALELAQEQLEEQRQEPQAAKAPELTSAGQADVTVQLSALQQQLESLAADGNSAQLQQERARMSICLRTIKVAAVGVAAWGACLNGHRHAARERSCAGRPHPPSVCRCCRRSLTSCGKAAAPRPAARAVPAPSPQRTWLRAARAAAQKAQRRPPPCNTRMPQRGRAGKPEEQPWLVQCCVLHVGSQPGTWQPHQHFSFAAPGSRQHPRLCSPTALPRLRDFLGVRPEQADPLERVLEAPVSSVSPESPSRRVLQALALAGNDSVDDGSSVSSDAKGGSAPPTVRKGRRNPLLASLSLAVSQLAEGSPRQADGMAQFIATPSTLHPTTSAHPLRASHPQPQPKRASPLRASQHSRLSTRSSFLKRPPADMVDLYRC